MIDTIDSVTREFEIAIRHFPNENFKLKDICMRLANGYAICLRYGSYPIEYYTKLLEKFKFFHEKEIEYGKKHHGLL